MYVCVLCSIYNLHSIPALHNFDNSSALIKYIDTVQNPHHECDGETGTITDKKMTI